MFYRTYRRVTYLYTENNCSCHNKTHTYSILLLSDLQPVLPVLDDLVLILYIFVIFKRFP